MTSWEADRHPATLVTRIYVASMRLRRDKGAFEGSVHTRAKACEL